MTFTQGSLNSPSEVTLSVVHGCYGMDALKMAGNLLKVIHVFEGF